MKERFSIRVGDLWLIETPPPILRQRLVCADFVASVSLDGNATPILFPAAWPGDALVLFPYWIDLYARNPQHVEWGGTLIHTTERVAIGQLGCKGRPDASGSVEVGYGLSPSHHGRGFATAAVRGLVGWLLEQPEVRTVTAECRTDNIASVRVLEKSGFVRTGAREDPEDGPLICWALTR